MARYRVGELDQRVTFQREVRTDDDMGGYSVEWKDAFTTWAHAHPMSGREREFSDRLNAEASYRFVVRYRTDFDERDRIMWDGVPYNIRVIATRGRREPFIEIEAERGVAQ